LALAHEAEIGLISGASVQVLVRGYPTWLAVTELTVHGGDLLKATLDDHSALLLGKDAIIGVRFGPVDD
jgi:hypothetical protein